MLSWRCRELSLYLKIRGWPVEVKDLWPVWCCSSFRPRAARGGEYQRPGLRAHLLHRGLRRPHGGTAPLHAFCQSERWYCVFRTMSNAITQWSSTFQHPEHFPRQAGLTNVYGVRINVSWGGRGVQCCEISRAVITVNFYSVIYSRRHSKCWTWLFTWKVTKMSV